MTIKSGHSDGDIRSAFTDALERSRGKLSEELLSLCGAVWNCTDILPSCDCGCADVPAGSTYAQAARAIKARA